MRLSTTIPPQGSESQPVLDHASIRAQLDRILSSELFQHSRRYPGFLRYVVENTLDGSPDDLKERTLGIAVFRRDPDYDTSADPVVRTTASEVRKRLESYYSDPTRAAELRIALPVGTYVPEFHAPPAPSVPIELETVPLPVATPRQRNWHLWAMAALVLLALGAGFTIRNMTTPNALQSFWEPVLKTPQPALLIMETLMAVPKRPITQPVAAVEEVMDPKLFLIVNEGNSKLAAYFSTFGKGLEFDLARNITLAKLRTRPFILKGAFNNPLTRQSVSTLRYSLNLDQQSLVRQIVDRQNPTHHWDSPMTTDLTKDYALIVRAPEPHTGQTMFVIAGLGERGGAAATEFLTNPKYMERFSAQSPGWERHNIEIVLQTELVNGDWGEPRIVTKYLW